MSVSKWEEYGGVRYPINEQGAVTPSFSVSDWADVPEYTEVHNPVGPSTFIPKVQPICEQVNAPTDHRFTISMVIEGAHVKIWGKRTNGQTLYWD